MKAWASRLALALLAVVGCNETHRKPATAPPRLVALVAYAGIDRPSVETAVKALSSVTDAKVVVLESKTLPKEAFYPPRGRYRADRLIAIQEKQPYWKVVGLTHRDISTTNGKHKDWGIFGLGYCPGKSSIVSRHRLGSSPERLRKVVVHEFGHTLGLPHCPTPRCLMNDAKGKAATVDAEKEFCPSCQKEIDEKGFRGGMSS